jgi:putative ABC transport system ATP-binding protein
MPDNPILQTKHLTRCIQEHCLVHDISIQVHHGEVLAIVGPSGAGKSSFLRLLNRLDEPTDGTVYLDGQDYREIPPPELRRRVGMVLQAPFLFPGTVAENIRFGPQQRGETLSLDTIEQFLQQVGLADYAERDIHNLSGGEAQRVSVIRTLANRPRILLVDEPTSALDTVSVQAVEQLITRVVQEQQMTCLMITHNLEQAARVAHRVMEIEKGFLKNIGPVADFV